MKLKGVVASWSKVWILALVFLTIFLVIYPISAVKNPIKQAESLGLTEEEFKVFDAEVQHYFSQFTSVSDYIIVYRKQPDRVDLPNVIIVKATARFIVPSPTAVFGWKDGKITILTDVTASNKGTKTQQSYVILQQQVETTRDIDVDGDTNPEFTIHWRYDDFPSHERADEVVAMIDTASRVTWNTICGQGPGQWGFREPDDSDGIIDIYLNDNQHFWGPYPADPHTDLWTFWFPMNNQHYIYLSHNIQEFISNTWDIEYPTEQDCFTNALSHEFFHGVENTYGVIAVDDWIAEGSARFEQTVINPNGEFYTPQNDQKRSLYIDDASTFLRSPEKTLGTGRSYTACIYWRYLFEHQGGIDTIRRVFEIIDTDDPVTFEQELNCINSALAPATTVRHSFIDFAGTNYFAFSSHSSSVDNRYYSHRASYYQNLKIVHDAPYEYSGKDLTIDGICAFGICIRDDTTTERYSANYIEIVSKEDENNDFEIVFSGNPDTVFVKQIIIFNSQYPDGNVIDFPDDRIIIPYPKNFDRIVLVVINVGHTGNGNYHVVLRHVKDIDTVLDIDRSGSMDWDNKMTAAKDAAKVFVDLLERPSGWWIFKTDRDKVGLVSFETSATLDSHLTVNFDDVKAVINGYIASGATNMGDALSKSITEMKTNGRDNTIWSIIYFTDGQTNTGLEKNEILNTLVPEAVNTKINIYTCGYGTDVDPTFLQDVANAANGKYFFAPDKATLIKIYTEMSHVIKGWQQLLSLEGTVQQGEIKTAGTFNIQSGVNHLKIILTWQGSDLDLILRDPNGNTVTPGMAGIIYSGCSAFPEYYELYAPMAGTWTIQVYGNQVPSQSEGFTIMVFQPTAMIQVKPTKWDISYPEDITQTFTVSEITGSIDLTDVTFTASDLTGTTTDAPVRSLLNEQAEAEELGVNLIPSITEISTESSHIIPSSSFSFTPNDITIPAGESRGIHGTFTLPPNTPIGDYSGTIHVTSNGGTSTISVTLSVNAPPDETPPVTSITTQGINGKNGWFTSDVQVILTANDNEGGSGIARIEYSFDNSHWNVYLNPFTIQNEGLRNIFYRSIDNANNIEDTKSTEIRIDKTPPVITLTTPQDGGQYSLKSTVLALYSATDTISGLASTFGTVPNGEAIPTSTVGPQTFSVTATDNAGNSVTKKVTYSITYNFGGILPPIKADGSSTFNKGSAVPVKFRLTDAGGNYITTATARLNLAPIVSSNPGQEIPATSKGNSNTGNYFRYDTTDNLYIFNLDTKPLSTGKWQLRIKLDDGTMKTVNIQLK